MARGIRSNLRTSRISLSSARAALAEPSRCFAQASIAAAYLEMISYHVRIGRSLNHS